jgi:hypothetical protein
MKPVWTCRSQVIHPLFFKKKKIALIWIWPKFTLTFFSYLALFGHEEKRCPHLPPIDEQDKMMDFRDHALVCRKQNIHSLR